MNYSFKYPIIYLCFVGKDLHGLDVEDVETRLQKLEKRVFVDQGTLPSGLVDLKNRVDTFKAKLEVCHIVTNNRSRGLP